MNSQKELPDILREKSNRLFFLKAILLGIQYGESEKRSLHKRIVQEEIFKLESANVKTSIPPHSILPSSKSSSTPTLTPTPTIPKSNPTISSIQQKSEFMIQKYEDILQELYTKRVNIVSQIGNVSANTYSKTLSLQQNQQNNAKVNQLKVLMAITNKEIEKYTILLNNIKKMKDNPQVSSQNILKNNTKNNIQQQQNKNIYQYQQPPSNLQQKSVSSFFEQQPTSFKEVEVEEEESNEDFMKELQETFGSLSSLLMSD